MKSSWSLIAVALTAAALTWLAASQLSGDAGPSATGHIAARPGGGDFTLQSAHGPVSLQDYRGKVVLLYFGYSFCPDVCPTSLAFMAAAMQQLSAAELERVNGLFISVDPARDTTDRLAQYAPAFHPRILGLTGPGAELDRITRRYGAVYRKQEGQSAGGYLVDHTSFTYVIAPDGSLAKVLDHGTAPDVIARAVRAALGST